MQHHLTFIRRGLAFAWLSLTGCADAPPAATPPDVASEDAAERSLDTPLGDPLALELGDGASPFARLDEGGTLFLERGSQGLQHVHFSVSAELPAGFHPVSHAFSRSAAPAPPYLLGPSQLSVPFISAPGAEPGVTAAFGILAVIPVPEPLLAAEPLYLHVRVDAQDGARAGLVSRAIGIAWP